jgi:hypothetical protein
MRTVDGTLSVSILATRNVSDNPCAWIEDVRTTRSSICIYGDCLWAVELEFTSLRAYELTSLRAYELELRAYELTSLRAYELTSLRAYELASP